MVLMLLISCSFVKMQGNNGLILFLHSEQVFTQVKMKTQVFVLISKNIESLSLFKSIDLKMNTKNPRNFYEK